MENKKIKIGVDLDDTIWKFHKGFFEYYNNKFGTNHKIENHFDYCLEDRFNISKIEVFNILDEFSYSNFSIEIELMEGAIDSIKKLNEKYEIFFITARHEGLFERTFNHLKKYFDFDFEILFVFDKDRNLIKEKVEYCLDKNIKIMIDDRLKTLNSCSRKGIKGILLNQPWNSGEKIEENIVRVNNWNEILEEIEK